MNIFSIDLISFEVILGQGNNFRKPFSGHLQIVNFNVSTVTTIQRLYAHRRRKTLYVLYLTLSISYSINCTSHFLWYWFHRWNFLSMSPVIGTASVYQGRTEGPNLATPQPKITVLKIIIFLDISRKFKHCSFCVQCCQ